jgi:DNA helicase HerA-like ATPase
LQNGEFVVNEMQDLCRSLRPILGRKIDAIWQMYLAEDADGKREIEDMLRIVQARALNRKIDSMDTVLPPPPQEIARGEYYVGDVEYGDKRLYPFGLREDELIQHCAIFGRSGSGK